MQFNEYQDEAYKTANPIPQQILMAALGLAGEAGEVIDLIKKQQFHGHTLPRHKLVRELGDVLWYVALVATVCGIPLNEVAVTNIDKLRMRYGDEFSIEKSINRAEGDE
jgi:NTP pyrophosphatase (non-canonical NTP hydrolase)